VTQPDLVAPRPSTPAVELGSSGSSGGLPSDLLQDSSRRLGVACLLYSAVWALHLVMINVFVPVLSTTQMLLVMAPRWSQNAVAAGVIAISLALFGYTRLSRCDCRLALDVGLGYEVILAAAIAFVNQASPDQLGISWICVLVVVHAMLVPNQPSRTLVASLLAASMDPLAVGIRSALGQPTPSAAFLAYRFLPNYICALIAVVPGHVIQRLGREVRQARELGSYQLGEVLGRAGMGAVHRATHRLLRRPAAIKLIRRDAVGAGDGRTFEVALHRFRREAQAVAALHSPHTIALYDFGATNDGALYYVMELLQGIDLETLVKRFGPVPPARMKHLVTQVCHSLAEAHVAGLIHRDIKPANIHTGRVGLDNDFVKVLDFGLVKVAMPEGVEASLATAAGVATGTPAYMAPEVCVGDPNIDGRADIYSLGCVAYWLLTGQRVFSGENAIQVMQQHLRSEPVPPSKRSELPIAPSVDAVVLACLAKDRIHRPADAAELARRLAECDVGDPWTEERAAQWWQAHVPEVAPRVSASGSRERALQPLDVG